MSFRVATKWDVARGQIRNKRRLALGPGAEGRVHWAINYHLPEIEGWARPAGPAGRVQRLRAAQRERGLPGCAGSGSSPREALA